MNKQGDLSSIIIMIAVIFALSIATIVFSRIFVDISDELLEMPRIENNTATAIGHAQDRAIPLLDMFIVFAFVGTLVGLIISSIYIDTHPAFTMAFILGVIIAVFLAIQFANIHSEVIENPALSSTADQFAMSNIIMGSLFPVLILITGVIVIVILYGKGRSRSLSI